MIIVDLIKLRELPGVDSIADLCRNSRNFEYPTSSYTQDKIDDVSIRLFGITQHDTKWNVEAYLAQLNDEYDDGDDDDDVDLDDDSYERSEEHTSELQSLMRISYAVFCLQYKTPAPASISSRQCRP